MKTRIMLAAAFAAMLAICVTFPCHASVYTDETAFKAALLPGYYVEDFTTTIDPLGNPQNFALNGFSYNMSAPTGLWPFPGAMSTASSSDMIRIEFTGLPVTAIGGIFWPTDMNGDNAIGKMTIAFDDGTTYAIPNAQSDTFRGFVSPGSLFSYIDITSDDTNYWPTVTNLYVGQAAPVPEPVSLLLLSPGLGGLLLGRRTFKG